MVLLRGLTWDHPRGKAGLEATADSYHRIHPGVEIRWDARSLREFGDQPLEKVVKSYDMIIVDHPFIGSIAGSGDMVPLDSVVPAEFLAEQERYSVGPSFRSYAFAGHQWALAVDGAAQVSAYRPDLFKAPPNEWGQVVRLVEDNKIRRRVATPLTPIDAISSFLTLCANAGNPAFQGGHATDAPVGKAALRILRTLARGGHPDSLTLDPPKTLEMMSQTDEIFYSPLMYGYSNYSRHGFRDRIVKFVDIPSSGSGPSGSNLGGAGLAVSSASKNIEHCANYAVFVASAGTQRGIYFEAGGQPAHAAAWEDPHVNSKSSNFFYDTRKTMEKAYLRPRYDGYPQLQVEAGELIHSFLLGDLEASKVLDELDAVYQRYRKKWESDRVPRNGS